MKFHIFHLYAIYSKIYTKLIDNFSHFGKIEVWFIYCQGREEKIMVRTTLKTKHRDTITFDYRYANYMDKPIIRITSSFSKCSIVVSYNDILFYIDGIVDGYSHYTDATGDYIEISKLANTTYIGICSTIANFSNDEYEKLIEWCLSVMSQMKEELSNA